MKKRFCLFALLLTMAVVLGGCANDNDQTTRTPKLIISWVKLIVYDAATEEQIIVLRKDDDALTLSVDTEYIFEFEYVWQYDPPISNQVDYFDEGLSFTFDEEFISLSESDVEDPGDHKFDVRTLAVTEGTELTFGLSTCPRTITITIV